MIQIITEYFIDVHMIKGGMQLNLGYASIIAMAWFTTFLIKRVVKSFQRKQIPVRS